jgi:rhodanese-related sulfurtransferase
MRLHLPSLFFAATIAFANTASAQEPATTEPTKAMIMAREGALVVDVREPDELAQLAYAAPNVVNIPLSTLETRTSEVPKDKIVVVACRSGNRSAQAIELLKAKGYTNLIDLEGGIYAWQEAGMPVKKSGTAAGGCCAGGKTDAKNCTPEQKAAGCGTGAKADAKSCSPEQKASGCCSGAPKAAAPTPAPADKQPKKN